ncbi:MAG: S8 family serine peptidase [Phycisphaerales bacterium]
MLAAQAAPQQQLVRPLAAVSGTDVDALQRSAPAITWHAARVLCGAAQLQRQGAAPERLSRDGVWKVAPDGRVHLTIHLRSADPAALDVLRALGVHPTAVDLRYGQQLDAWLTQQQAEAVAALSVVRSVDLPAYAHTSTGSVTSAGVAQMGSNLIGSTAPCYDGDGVKVGVLSDGISDAPSAVATGDLPQAANGQPAIQYHPTFFQEANEGTAMLEIVHDVAPKAALAFAGPISNTEMVEAIQWMTDTAHCQVICDDLGFRGEPWFADGPVALAAADAVNSAGVVYVSAAGNDGLAHHQRQFQPTVRNTAVTGNVDWTLYNWDGAGEAACEVWIPGNSSLAVYMQWDDPFGAATHDFNLHVLDKDETTIVDSSAGLQNGTQNPFEFIVLDNTGPALVKVHVWIQAVNAAAWTGPAPQIEFFVGKGDMRWHIMPNDSIFGHGARPEVISVGAVAPGAGCSLREYSSQGPATVRYPAPAERIVPTLVAADGVLVSGAGCFGCQDPCPPQTGCAFEGTSAAAPHIAGLAAQLLEAAPGSAPATIRNAIVSTCTACPSGSSTSTGAGIPDALGAARALTPGVFACPMDINEDGLVDGTDLGILLASWGTPSCDGHAPCRADFNCDGAVDAQDLGMLLGTWGPCQGPA